MRSEPTTAGVPSLRSTADTEPWGLYDDLRDRGLDVFWDEGMDAWIVTSYDLCKQVLRQDEHAFQRAESTDATNEHQMHAALRGSPRDIALLSGEPHSRFHHWWLRAVSPETVRRWQPTLIRPVIDDALDRIASHGSAELVAQLAERIPIRVMASVLGLPWRDEDWIAGLRAYMDMRAEYVESVWDRADELDEMRRNVLDVVASVRARLRPFAERARAGDVDNLTALYWRDGPDVLDGWDIEDVLTGMTTALFAGSDTTSHGLANCLWMLLTQPEVQDELRAGGDDAMSRFVEEVLRILGVAQFTSPLVAREQVEVGGVTIREGDAMHTLLGAANRDPRHYRCPHELDLTRKSPRDHVAFFIGRRSCGGMWLARGEMQEVVRAVLDRLPDLRFAPDAPPARMTGYILRSYRPLHAVFTSPVPQGARA